MGYACIISIKPHHNPGGAPHHTASTNLKVKRQNAMILMISRLSQRQSCTLWPGPVTAGWEPSQKSTKDRHKSGKGLGP